MLEDDMPASATQARQIAVGQAAAINAAVHALIATHLNPAAFSSALDAYAHGVERILLTGTALQFDDGMRQAYSETMHSLRAAIGSG